jgi:fructose/tagatose bisphosphate aldolase
MIDLSEESLEENIENLQKIPRKNEQDGNDFRN